MPNMSAVAGEPLYVACPVAGYPIDSIVWQKGKPNPRFCRFANWLSILCVVISESVLA